MRVCLYMYVCVCAHVCLYVRVYDTIKHGRCSAKRSDITIRWHACRKHSTSLFHSGVDDGSQNSHWAKCTKGLISVPACRDRIAHTSTEHCQVHSQNYWSKQNAKKINSRRTNQSCKKMHGEALWRALDLEILPKSWQGGRRASTGGTHTGIHIMHNII